MLKRLAEVIFYTTFLICILLTFIGIISFDIAILFICLTLSSVLGGFGWSVRYVLTGEKNFHPKLRKYLLNIRTKIKIFLLTLVKKLQKNTILLISKLKEKDSWSEKSIHPWRRYFARMLDILVNGAVSFFVIGLVSNFIFPEYSDNFLNILETPFGRFFDISLTILFSLFLTSLLIGLTSSSLGKYIFGIKVVNQKNKKMGYKMALIRELQIYYKGLGLGLPIISVVTMIVAYRKLLMTGKTTWDRDGKYKVLSRNNNYKQIFLNIFGFIFFILIIGILNSLAFL